MSKQEKADRAKLFLPFDSLKGFREALKEKEKIVVPKRELSPEEAETLSDKLNQIKKGKIVKVIFYENQEYIELEGMVSNVDFTFRTVTIVQKKISFDDIVEVSGQGIKSTVYQDEG